jgi:hypothetical protein
VFFGAGHSARNSAIATSGTQEEEPIPDPWRRTGNGGACYSMRAP